jgi:N utilization substance protein A
MGFEDEDFSGRCAAILSNGKRCPNAALPNSRYCGLPAHQALADQEGDEVAADSPGEAAAEEELVASSEDVAGEDEEAAPDGVVPASAEDFAEGTDLGPDREDPGTPDGAADSPAVPVGASATSEPELDGTDPDHDGERQDSDPIEQRLEDQ